MKTRCTLYRARCGVALVAVAALAACSDTPTQRSPTDGGELAQKSIVSLFPTAEGAPGAILLIRGEDFLGDCAVRIALDGSVNAPLAETVPGKDGTFSVQAALPADLGAGTHELGAQGYAGANCDQPSANAATAEVVVTAPLPTLVIDTFEARPGTTVTIAGHGFCAESACSPVTLLIDGAVVGRGIAVDPDGSFVAETQVPAVDNAGEIMVVAEQSGADGATLRGFGDLSVTVRPGGDRPVIL